MRRSSFSVKSLPGCVTMRPSSSLLISLSPPLQVDVLELVERERLLEDALHVRAAAAALRRDEVGLG